MNETNKLEETKFFYCKMIEEQKNIDAFKYYFSAFLGAARSVLQYACKEAKTKTGGKTWYDNYISSNLVLRFFRDKRNINFHAEPVYPQPHFFIDLKFNISIPSPSISFNDLSDGPRKKLTKKLEEEKVTGWDEVKYKIDDWIGAEDVLTLCQMYIQKLDEIIRDGVANGYITG